MHARLPPAFGFDVRPAAAHLVHVGGRAADVADDSLELRIARHRLNLADDRIVTPRLNDPPLMRGDRAKRAAPKAAAHDRYRILDHLKGGNRLAVRVMRMPRVRQVVDRVHRLLRDRKPRRVADDRLLVMKLDERPSVVRVRLVVDHFRCFGKGGLVGGDSLVAGKQQKLIVGD